jgi:excisionase family DNA binding protein
MVPRRFDMKTWLNVAEAAEYAGVSRDTIYTACERREIHHARVGGLKPEWIDGWNDTRRGPRPSAKRRCTEGIVAAERKLGGSLQPV